MDLEEADGPTEGRRWTNRVMVEPAEIREHFWRWFKTVINSQFAAAPTLKASNALVSFPFALFAPFNEQARS
jgi:hypothetical protein